TSSQVVPPIVSPAGQFTTMSMPPGKYLVRASINGWLLRSAMLGGRDVSVAPFDLDSTDMGGLIVTFFDRPSQLSGLVRNSRGDADDSTTIVLVPADDQV